VSKTVKLNGFIKIKNCFFMVIELKNFHLELNELYKKKLTIESTVSCPKQIIIS